MTLLGVYAGNDALGISTFEGWLGRRLDLYTVFVGDASWDDFVGGLHFELSTFSAFHGALTWSIPLIPKTGQLSEAAAGAYDGFYSQAATIIATGRHEAPVYVRTGWEQNGSWMAWSARGREQHYIEAFRHFVTCFRKVSPRFQFIWCPNIGQDDPAPSYPGDDVVDIIGMDVYHFPEWDPKTAEAAWLYMVARPFGLQWHLEFSRRHRKPMAFPEWGVSSDAFESYVTNMARWFKSGSILFQSYWDSNADYRGQLSNGQNPETGRAFRHAFRPPP